MRVLGDACVLACVALSGSADAAANDLIAFVREGNIWLMRTSGGNEQQLSHSGKCDHPSWGPGGQCLVFESDGNIWRMALPRTDLTKLTSWGSCHQPAWRPGANEVWYCRLGEPEEDGYRSAFLWSVNVLSRHARFITEIDSDLIAGPGRTCWRSDGKAIAVDLEEGGEMGWPHFYASDGTTLDIPLDATISRWGGWAWTDAAWSPVDPSVLAVAELYRESPATTLTSEFAWSLVLFNTRTKAEQPLFDAPHPSAEQIGMVSWPSWSPDGKKLAFCLWHATAGPKKPSIWTIGADGQGAREVADNATEPAWRPWIAESAAQP